MRITRFSVSRLMAVVGIVALNLAAARRLAAYDDRLMVGVMPTAIVLQVALFRLIRAQGSRRAFWAGFLTAGFLTMLSFGWANRLSTSFRVTLNTTTDIATVIEVAPGCFGGDQIHAIWNSYANVVARCLPDLPQYRLVTAVVFLMPQMLAALACGLFAWLVNRGTELCRSDASRKYSVKIEKLINGNIYDCFFMLLPPRTACITFRTLDSLAIHISALLATLALPGPYSVCSDTDETSPPGSGSPGGLVVRSRSGVHPICHFFPCPTVSVTG